MIPYLQVDTDEAVRLGLDPTEALVLTAVKFYCRKAPYNWKRNANQICRDLPYMPDRTTVSRAIDRVIKSGAIIADGCILTVQNARENVQNARETVQNTRENVQNARHIINNNINNNRERKEPDGGRSHANFKKEDDFIVPTWEEVMDYARGRTNWRGSTQEMREEAADDYFAKMSECGWLVDGAPVVNWKPGVYRFYKQARKRYEREAGVRAATMAQAGFRPETRGFEHACAMNERKKEEKAMEAIYTDEDRKADAEMYERLGVKPAAPSRSDSETAKVHTATLNGQAARASASSIRMSTGHSPSTNQQICGDPNQKEPEPVLSDEERMGKLGFTLEERELIRKSREAQKEREKKKNRAAPPKA